MEKKFVKCIISTNLLYELDGCSPQQFQDIVNNYIANYPQCKNWKFDLEWGWCDESPELHLIAERLETDIEFERRKKKSESAKKAAKKRKVKKELEEIELLEKLKTKYEKNNYKKPK